MERWKAVKGLSHYEVSDFGRIRVRSRTTINKLGVRRFHTGKELSTNYKNLEWVTKKGNALHARKVLGVGKRSLTNRDVFDIRQAFNRNRLGLCKELAKKYSVHVTVIYSVRDRKTYRYV